MMQKPVSLGWSAEMAVRVNNVIQLNHFSITRVAEKLVTVSDERDLLKEALRDIAHGPVGYWNNPDHAEEVIRDFMKTATEALKKCENQDG